MVLEKWTEAPDKLGSGCTAKGHGPCRPQIASPAIASVCTVPRSGPRFWQLFRRDRLTRTETDQRRALLLP